MRRLLNTALVTILVTTSATACGMTGVTNQAKPARTVTITPATPALSNMSAANIRDKMISAINSAGSVHVTVHNRHGALSGTYSDDSLTDSGRQVITLSTGARAEVLLINAVGYVEGNYKALTNFFGFPADTASKYAGKWISFKQGQTGYQQVTAGLTLSSVISELKVAAPLSKLPAAAAGGTPVVRIRGTAPAASGAPAGTEQIIEIAATGSPLPVSSEEKARGEAADVTFSSWGETPHLSAPVGAIPISAVLG